MERELFVENHGVAGCTAVLTLEGIKKELVMSPLLQPLNLWEDKFIDHSNCLCI